MWQPFPKIRAIFHNLIKARCQTIGGAEFLELCYFNVSKEPPGLYCIPWYTGLLNNIFNQIYDLEIIKEEEFRQWRDKGVESFGKGTAVATVQNFFDWLDSGEIESEDDT